jgi:hypothetical protein
MISTPSMRGPEGHQRCKNLIIERFRYLAPEDMKIGELVLVVQMLGLPFSYDIY